MSLGAISSPASHLFKSHELAYQIRESKVGLSSLGLKLASH